MKNFCERLLGLAQFVRTRIILYDYTRNGVDRISGNPVFDPVKTPILALPWDTLSRWAVPAESSEAEVTAQFN